MVASSSQPSGSGHAPIESERTSAATFPGVQENHRLAGNRPSSNNQPVSQFLLSYAFFTYHLLHHAPDFPLHRLFLSPSRELNSQAVLLLPGLPSSAVSFQFSQMLHGSSRYREKRRKQSVEQLPRWFFTWKRWLLADGGGKVVSRRFGLINFLNDGTWYRATTSFFSGILQMVGWQDPFFWDFFTKRERYIYIVDIFQNEK